MTLCVVTRSPAGTRTLGRAVGSCLGPGAVLALSGDLGSGKTVFVQGLARGLAVPEEYYVTSPTYTLVHEYPGRCPLFHIDLYRLEGGADLDDLGLPDLLGGEGVVAVEWAERLDRTALPTAYVSVRIETGPDDERTVRFTPCGDGTDTLRKIETVVKEKQWD